MFIQKWLHKNVVNVKNWVTSKVAPHSHFNKKMNVYFMILKSFYENDFVIYALIIIPKKETGDYPVSFKILLDETLWFDNDFLRI